MSIYSDPGEMTAREQHVLEAKYAQEFKTDQLKDDNLDYCRYVALSAVRKANAAVNSLRLVGKVLP